MDIVAPVILLTMLMVIIRKTTAVAARRVRRWAAAHLPATVHLVPAFRVPKLQEATAHAATIRLVTHGAGFRFPRRVMQSACG